MRRKKGQFMELDLAIALLIIIAGLIIIKSFFIQPHHTLPLQAQAQDATSMLQTTNTQQIDTTLLHNQPQENSSLATYITKLLIVAEEPQTTQEQKEEIYEDIEHIITTTLQNVITANTNYNISIISNQQTYSLHNSTAPVSREVTRRQTMLSGLEVDRPLTGYLVQAFLQGGTTDQSTYTYFGGFIGQGNISTNIESPVITSNIEELFIEGDFHESFELYVNEEYCTDISITEGELLEEDVTEDCAEYLQKGDNKISFQFTGENTSNFYIGGGYVRLSYTSTELFSKTNPIVATQPITAVNGTINLYDSISIPGTLQDIEIAFDYLAESNIEETEFYITLGNTIIYSEDTLTGNREHINIDLSDLQSLGITRNELSDTTTPLRIGLNNIEGQLSSQANIDAILITDLSGSMNWRMDNGNDGITVNDCENETLYQDSTRRISVARCAGKSFSSSVLSEGESSVGLVGYASNIRSDLAPNTNLAAIEEEINTYTGNGGTCICCGFIRAGEQFMDLYSDYIINRNDRWFYINTTDEPEDEGQYWFEEPFTINSSWGNAPAILGEGEVLSTYRESTDTTINLPTNGALFLRKTFTIESLNDYERFYIDVLLDGEIDIYLNGEIFTSYSTLNQIESNRAGRYWDTALHIPTETLHQGENTIAIRLSTTENHYRFDLGLAGVENNGRTEAVVMMTDGQANGNCRNQLGSAPNTPNLGDLDDEHALEAANQLMERFSPELHTIRIGPSTGTLLEVVATEAAGNEENFHIATSAEDVVEIYNEIARQIIQAARFDAQIINTEATVSINSTLYEGGTITTTYTPESITTPTGNLLIQGIEQPFSQGSNCIEETFSFPSFITPISGTIVSYSAEDWTSRLEINGEELFNINNYAEDLINVGDPFILSIPQGLLEEDNTLTLRIRDNSEEHDCNPESKLIYKAIIPSTILLEQTFPKAEGCHWTVLMRGEEKEFLFPTDYEGNDDCYYDTTHTTKSQSLNDEEDVWEQIVYEVFSTYDINQDGNVDVDFSDSSLELHLTEQVALPYLWGPAVLEVVTWQ